MPTHSTEPPAETALLTRRAAIARATALFGTALAAPTIAGMLAGCGDQSASRTDSAIPALKTLSPEQERLVAAAAEVILPTTGTPGARQVGVSLFVDRMLADYYPADARTQFLAGLARLDARAVTQHRNPFVSCTAAQQFALIDALDAQAFDAGTVDARSADARAAIDSAPSRPTGVTPDATPDTIAAVGANDARTFYRVLKELTIAGYYTSEAGATRELRLNPMGRWRADVPYSELGAGWA